MTNPLSLQGKVAIVTGASRGIGEAIATAFAQQGARLVIGSRKAEAIEAAAARIRGQGGQVVGVPCHMGREEDRKALFAAAREHFGQVDILVNNAATNAQFGPLGDADLGAWQ